MMGNMQPGQNPFFGNAQQYPQNMQNPQHGNWFGWNPNTNRMQSNQRPSADMWVPVNSLEEAKNVFVQPGERKWIMILNAMMFAVKSVNDAGATEFQAYDFSPHIEVQQPVTQQSDGIPMDEIKATLDIVLRKLSNMENEVYALKEVKNNGKPARSNVNGANASKPTNGANVGE